MDLVTLIFDLLTLKLYASRIKGGEPSFRISARWAFGFSNYSLSTRRTGGQTDGQKQRLLPPSLRAGA